MSQRNSGQGNAASDNPEVSVSPETETVDGVVFADVDSGVACLKCDGALEIAHIDNFKIACCGDCHGLLIEARLLAGIIGSRRAAFDGIETAARPMDPNELRQQAFCVVCTNQMDTHAYCGPGSVVIDSCHHCGLVWLDRRELRKIIESPGRRELLASDLREFDPKNSGITSAEGSLFQAHAAAVAWILME